MGLSFVTPSSEHQYRPLLIRSSSLSVSSVTDSAKSTVNVDTSFVNEQEDGTTTTFSTRTGLTTNTADAVTSQKYEAFAASTGLTNFASNSASNSGEFGVTSETSSDDGEGNTGSGSTTDSGSVTESSSSSRGFTDKTRIQGSVVVIEATTRNDPDQTTFSSSFAASTVFTVTSSTNKQATVRGAVTTTQDVQSFASRLMTATILSQTTTTRKNGESVKTISSTTTSTNFVNSWYSTDNSRQTTTSPTTAKLTMITTFAESDDTFSVEAFNVAANLTVHVAENSPFDPVGVGRVINAGEFDPLATSSPDYQRSEGKIDFVDGDSTYRPETYSEDQNVVFVTVEASALGDPQTFTGTENPAHNSSVQYYETIATEERTFCDAGSTGTYAHKITTTKAHEEGDAETFTYALYDPLTTTSTDFTTLNTTIRFTVNINHPDVNASSISTTAEIEASTVTSVTREYITNREAVINGNVSSNTSTTGSNESQSFTNVSGFTFENNSSRDSLVLENKYFNGGVTVPGSGFVDGQGIRAMLRTRTVRGFAPFNMSTNDRPNVYLGYSTTLESSEGFASWNFAYPHAIQRFNLLTNLDDSPCRTVSETFTNEDVTFEQTITDSNNIQYFESTRTFINSDYEIESTVDETSSSSNTYSSTDSNGESFTSSSSGGFGNSVPETTTTSAFVTMSRTWTTGFISDDTVANADKRSLTYRGKHGNKGTIAVQLCERIQHNTFEVTERPTQFRGPATATVEAPYHIVATLRDSSSTSSKEYFDGDRNTDRETDEISFDQSVEYLIEYKNMVVVDGVGPGLIDANTYDNAGYVILNIEED